MKKTILLLAAFSFLMSCKSSIENVSSENKQTFDLSSNIKSRVNKIDSIGNYYVIYTRDSIGYRYKIISKKIKSNSCEKIKLNNSYNFKIKKLLSNDPPSNGNGEISTPINYLDITRCVELDSITKICTEPGMSNIYSVYNLNGLCIINYVESGK